MKDQVVMKVAMLGYLSWRPEGNSGQMVSLVQKLGWGTVMVTISNFLGSHHFKRPRSLVPISCLSLMESIVSNRNRQQAPQIER